MFSFVSIMLLRRYINFLSCSILYIQNLTQFNMIIEHEVMSWNLCYCPNLLIIVHMLGFDMKICVQPTHESVCSEDNYIPLNQLKLTI